MNNKKPLWIAMIVVALIGICVSIFLFAPDTNTAKDAVICDKVTEEGQNAYLDLVGISPVPFATYEGYESLGLYFALDEYEMYYIVVMDSNRVKNYTEQIKYWSGITETAPKAVHISGKGYLIDSEIKGLALDVIGEGDMSDDEFIDTFGVYFLNTNVSATSSGSFLAAVIVMFVSVALLAIGLYNFFAGQNIAEDNNHRYGLAIACGILGLIVAACIPMAIGMFLKRIMVYAMIAVPIGFILGYNLIEKEMKLATKALFIVLATFMGFVSMYVVYAWTYYNGMNGGSVGISFAQAASSLLDNLDNFDKPFSVKMNLVIAPVIAAVIAIAYSFGKKEEAVSEQAKEDTYTYANPEAIRRPEVKPVEPAADDSFGYFDEATTAENNTENNTQDNGDNNN